MSGAPDASLDAREGTRGDAPGRAAAGRDLDIAGAVFADDNESNERAYEVVRTMGHGRFAGGASDVSSSLSSLRSFRLGSAPTLQSATSSVGAAVADAAARRFFKDRQ